MNQQNTERVKDTDIRYQPNETPPLPIVLGLGAQLVVLTISGVILTPVVIFSAAGIGGEYQLWAIFAALFVSGVTTILQAVRVGQFGSGHILMMGCPAPSFQSALQRLQMVGRRCWQHWL